MELLLSNRVRLTDTLEMKCACLTAITYVLAMSAFYLLLLVDGLEFSL